ncbi:hypothetical protein FRC10_006395 [Ceratobasidium sp. 414]|nr:hypothetical protein FRC10_006395 [Ceratobasidium sp. 414]
MPVTDVSMTSTNSGLRSRGLTRNAAGLVASSLAGLVSAPGVLESARTVRDLTIALKPNVLQTPKDNDATIRRELEVVNDMILRIENIAELLQPVVGSDPNSSVVAFLVHLQLLLEFLETSRDVLAKLRSQPYRMKLINQVEIGQQLLEYDQQKNGHLRILVSFRSQLAQLELTTGMATQLQESGIHVTGVAELTQHHGLSIRVAALETQNIVLAKRIEQLNRISIPVFVIFENRTAYFFFQPPMTGKGIVGSQGTGPK